MLQVAYLVRLCVLYSRLRCDACAQNQRCERFYSQVGIVGGGVGGLNPQFMSTDAHFWVKIGHKLQFLGKISHISAADPPSSFRSIPTLFIARVHTVRGVSVFDHF